MSSALLDLFVHRADLPILPGNIGDLPRLGFGLWRYPLVSFSIELAPALLGACHYWRAANRVVKTEGTGGLAATIAASLIAIFAVLILWLDYQLDALAPERWRRLPPLWRKTRDLSHFPRPRLPRECRE